jgi:hypothetical protein
MEEQLVPTDAATNRDTGCWRRAFRTSVTGVFINVYELVSNFDSHGLSGSFPVVQRPRPPIQNRLSSKTLPGLFLPCSFYPLQTSRNRKGSSTFVMGSQA